MLGIRRYRNTAIDLFQGDITTFVCDAIVNAANETLSGGGGVDGAIHRAGGPEILEACQLMGPCKVGQAVATKAGKLPAQIVIHTVGPVWQGGDHGEPELLYSAYANCLKLAAKADCPHVAFPSISTGAYAYPIEQASMVAMKAIKETLDEVEGLRRITLVQFSLADYDFYQKALFATFPNSH